MITTREAGYGDIPVIAQIHIDTWRSTYRGIIPDKVLASLSYEQRKNSWHQVFDDASKANGFTYLADNKLGQVIGFVNGGKERTGNPAYKGELNAIYILKDHQQKGVGRELVRLAAQRLSHMEIHSMLAWVLEANPACNFYEALGGQRVQRKKIERGGSSITEVAYGWKDISILL